MLVRSLDNAPQDDGDYTLFYDDEYKKYHQSKEKQYYHVHFHNLNMKTTIIRREPLILAMFICVENTDSNNWLYFCVENGHGGDC